MVQVGACVPELRNSCRWAAPCEGYEACTCTELVAKKGFVEMNHSG